MKRIKPIIKLSGIIILLSIVIFGFTSLPYFVKFKDFFISKNPEDWGAFGGFIGGLVSVVNLSVFIIITIYISRLSNKSSERQIQTQKKTLISQFRQNEINKLNEELDKAFVVNGDEKKGKLINIYSQVSIYLTNFLNQKQYLFPILGEEFVIEQTKTLIEKYNQISMIIDEFHGQQNFDLEKQKDLETKIQATIMMKSELIEKLQTFVVKELEK